MAKALKVAAVVAGVAALAIVTGGAAAGLGISLATSAFGVSASGLLLASTGLSLASAALMKKPGVTSSQTDRLYANIDPRAFRKTVLGSTAMPIDVRHEEWIGNDQDYCFWIVCLASHRIEGVDELWVENELAWTAAGGVQGKYRGYLTVPDIVLEGSPANAINRSGQWDGTRHLTGCAYMHLRWKITGNSKKTDSPFQSGPPSRITIVGRGSPLYDPRRDDTVPGGSGPMRWNDQSTWRYTTDDGAVIGENLALQVLRDLLGWRITNPVTGAKRLAVGGGLPGTRINLPSFAVGANLCDEMVNRAAGGQEPRYRGAGVLSEGDDPKTRQDMMLVACCGRLLDTSGKLSLSIAHNDLAEIATDEGLLTDDVVGPFEWDSDPSLEQTPNVVRGRYVDASATSLYQLIDFPEVRIDAGDGIDRILTLDVGFAESPSQAQRVVRQGLQRKQLQRTFTAPFDIRAWNWPVGAIVPFTFAPLGFVRVPFRVVDQEYGEGGICNMTLRFESDLIYRWDADDKLPVIAAPAVGYDPTRSPVVLALEEAATAAVVEEQAEVIQQQQQLIADQGELLISVQKRVDKLEAVEQ